MKLKIGIIGLLIMVSLSLWAQKISEKDSIVYFGMVDSFNYYLHNNSEIADSISEKILSFAKDKQLKEKIGFAIYTRARFQYKQKELQKTDSLVHLALDIFNEVSSEMDIALCYSLLGTINIDKGNYVLAKEWFSKSLLIKEKIQDELGIAFIDNNIGTIYDYSGNPDSASFYYFKSLKIFEKLDKRPDMQSNIMNNISVIYYGQERYLDAIKLAKNAAKINRENKKLSNLSYNYVSLANYYLVIDSIVQAKQYAQMALDQANEIGGAYEKLYTNAVLGDISVKEKDPVKALEFYNDFMESPVEKNDYMISEVMGNMAEAYFHANQLSQAIQVGRKSLDIQKRIGSNQSVLLNERRLATYNSKVGDYKNAFLHLSNAMALKDSIFNENMDTRIREVEEKYQTEKKEAENQKLKREKELIDAKLRNQTLFTILAILGLTSFAFLSFLLFKLSRKRKENIHILKENNDILNDKYDDLKLYNTDLILDLKKEREKPEKILQQEITLSDKRKTCLKLESILYIESRNRAIFIHTTDQKEHKDWQTLKNYMELLPKEYFQQVSRSFIVNTTHIVSKEKDKVILSGDVGIVTSDKYLK